MKNKLFIGIIVVMMIVSSVIGFAACDKINTGKEETPQTTDLPSDDKDKTSDDDTEISDTIVLTAETDFDALESDKVSEEEFNKCFYELCRLMPSAAAGENLEYGYWFHGFKDNVSIECAVYGGETPSFDYKGSAFIKRDGLKLQVNQNPNNPTETEYYIVSDDFKTAYINGKIKDETWIRKNMEQFEKNFDPSLNYASYFKFDENKKCYVSSFEGTAYESSVPYEGAQSTLKIKNGRIIYYTIPSRVEIRAFKLYDIGTTKIDLPASICLPFAN